MRFYSHQSFIRSVPCTGTQNLLAIRVHQNVCLCVVPHKFIAHREQTRCIRIVVSSSINHTLLEGGNVTSYEYRYIWCITSHCEYRKSCANNMQRFINMYLLDAWSNRLSVRLCHFCTDVGKAILGISFMVKETEKSKFQV